MLLAASLTATTWAMLLVIAPVLEELVFRKGMHEVLLRRLAGCRSSGVALANAATALSFALAHVALNPTWLSALTSLPALVIGVVYQRSRRLAPCVALHAVFNAVWLVWVTAYA